jgi:hypothetical protein
MPFFKKNKEMDSAGFWGQEAACLSIFHSLSYSPLFRLTRETATSSSKRAFSTKKREINPGFEWIKENDRHSNRAAVGYIHLASLYYVRRVR